LKCQLTSLDNKLVRRCLVANDQERQPAQNIALILEAGTISAGDA
jgi:hypothetical protein